MDRFQPIDRRHGSQPYHYALDQLGAMVVATELDRDPDKIRWQQDKALAIGRSQRLAHLVDTDGFFSSLLPEGRRQNDCGSPCGGPSVSALPTSTRSPGPTSHVLPRVRPLDRNPRTVGKEAEKLRSPPARQWLRWWILFCFGHPRREAGARRALAEATVPVATAALGPTQRPHEAIWAPIGYDGPRMSLAELAGVPHPPESYRRIEETQESRRQSEEQWWRDHADSYGHS